MRGVTKTTALQFERTVAAALTEAFGTPVESYTMEWTVPVKGGQLELTFVLGSRKPGAVYRSRTLFCRGPKGKDNFHTSPSDPPLQTIARCLWHVSRQLDPDDRERFDAITATYTMPSPAP